MHPHEFTQFGIIRRYDVLRYRSVSRARTRYGGAAVYIIGLLQPDDCDNSDCGCNSYPAQGLDHASSRRRFFKVFCRLGAIIDRCAYASPQGMYPYDRLLAADRTPYFDELCNLGTKCHILADPAEQ
jgi:hypothetical protein